MKLDLFLNTVQFKTKTEDAYSFTLSGILALSKGMIEFSSFRVSTKRNFLLNFELKIKRNYIKKKKKKKTV